MATSPSILNYQVGKGTVSFTPSGGTLRSLGNCSSLSVSPTVTKLDHFSSQAGLKTKDRSVTVETGATVSLVLDEITAANLQLALSGGTITAGAFDILAASEIEGELVFTGTNTIGNTVTLTLLSVSFSPNGSVEFISDEWNQIEIQGEVLAVAGDFGTVLVTDAV